MFRREYGRCVAVLTRFLGDIPFAEEAVQDAFAVALSTWPATGMPESPVGWLIRTAKNKALDRLRREASRPERHLVAQALAEADDVEQHDLDDDHLRLIFTCCHPALAPDVQVALTLRLIGGLGTENIARAFLQKPATVAQRLSRAKAKIRDAGIPYRTPSADDLPARLSAVLSVVYLVFNEGYSTSPGTDAQRTDLCDEAIRLCRLLADLLPLEAEVRGLLALMLLIDARRAARVVAGELVLLPDQDRSTWDRRKIEEGCRLLEACVASGRPGPYQLQAAINAVHDQARSPGDTDWAQILRLYDQLLEILPSPVVALNRAVAVAEVRGPAKALELVEAIHMPNYHLHQAVRADLLGRVGRIEEAAAAYRSALDQCADGGQRDMLIRKLEALGSA